jgi:CheY-like chemotaxis protein
MNEGQSVDLARLGLASAALMHDLQALLGPLREHAAFTVEEIESGRLPLSSARSSLLLCEEIQALVRDVVASVSGQGRQDSFDPVPVVHAEISGLARRVSPLDVRCRTSLPGGTWVRGRRTLLGRSVGNLLRNASRHAREQVEASLYTEIREGRRLLVIAVEDDGAGVPEEMREQLFLPGVHGGHGGSGLGLASAVWAVAHLGGEIRLGEPKILGGARFEIRLPAHEPAGDGRAIDPGARPLEGRAVAVIDDDEMVRRVMIRLLSRMGARVVTTDVSSLAADTGLDALARTAPDAILLDLHLGGVSGLDVWRRLQARFPELAQRVAFFSGAAGWSADDKVLEETGRPVIAKGAEIGELVSALERLIHAAPAGPL